ncbi:MAG: hypothetical protein COU47_04345 [Candidatus Niyogibacteria bacterium CG10_big_fil_rev_8_21_14_0_10_46_36]|uniref:Uncharacterized protein n=1 Tax=Candidatus Niyogibacteria bacterium CG10_big_fil_rev_8_21_14_0_10_46_36 TaxID=1974726 RepID=A0A2H0TCL9_9BACT|nr:MAG: hypothetical protein COU47_04345 [Candidatus Niyogibacteria bacterium CG10_big_fil_rev_8_21_14_0_10_46_36]
MSTTSEQQNKKLTLTVSIPTCYGGWSLIETARSIRASEGVGDFRFIIVADRTPLTDEIKTELRKLNVELYWNEDTGSQIKKIKQMVDMAESDIFVSTQDDITFLPDTLYHIARAFEADPQLTMIGARVLPLPPETFFESIMASMVRAVDYIGMSWNKKQNYLMASGRCLAYRTSHIQKFRMPENIVNSDIFMYLENRRLGGTFARPDDAKVLIRCPQSIKDQIGPSSRYQYSSTEMQKWFGVDIQSVYKIPFGAFVYGAFREYMRSPIRMTAYALVFVYTRIFRKKSKKVLTSMWSVDTSTKNIR